MDVLTANEIVELPLNKKEKNHRSRTRLAFHVYLSRYFFDFKRRSINEQNAQIFEVLGVRLGRLLLEDAEYDSTDSADYNPRVRVKVPRHIHTLRCAARRWNAMADDLKEAWGIRASRLNDRPLSGSFLDVPQTIGGDNGDSLRTYVLAALSEDWHIVWRMFNTMLKKPVRRGMATTKYSFGGEHVTLGLQSFKYFVLPSLLRHTLFGSQYEKLQGHEIITKNKKSVLVHIGSQERMSQLFCCYDLNAAVHTNGIVKHTFCGKVGVFNTVTDKHVFGYILSESNNRWEILLENNERVWFERDVVSWDRQLKKFTYTKKLEKI